MEMEKSYAMDQWQFLHNVFIHPHGEKPMYKTCLHSCRTMYNRLDGILSLIDQCKNFNFSFMSVKLLPLYPPFIPLFYDLKYGNLRTAGTWKKCGVDGNLFSGISH